MRHASGQVYDPRLNKRGCWGGCFGGYKHLSQKPDDFSLILRICIKLEGENQLHEVSLTSMHVLWSVCVCVQINVQRGK